LTSTQRDITLLEHSSHNAYATPVAIAGDVRVYWDISKYGRISPYMICYDRVYWDIFKHGRISPDMVGYDNM
jgi:hypothetical protein